MAPEQTVARIDSEGRINVPSNLRDLLELEHGDYVRMTIEPVNDGE